MNQNEFKNLYVEMKGREQMLLGFKRGEYAKDDKDVLINFKQVGVVSQQSPEQVCMTYLLKHIQSIAMAVRHDQGIKFEWDKKDGGEGLAQRFADARNYLVLLAGLIIDAEKADKSESNDEHYGDLGV